MRKLSDFIGSNNIDTIQVLVEWINSCYRAKDTVETNYAILYGDSGNGKTFLIQLLAELFHLELFRVTPFDIESGQDIYDILKSVNITTLQGKKHRIILVDDFHDFKKNYQNQLLKIKDISQYPVVYSMRRYPTRQDFINGSLKASKGRLLKVEKPLSTEILEYLKEHSSLPIPELRKIAEESTSFRSAILCVNGNCVNDTLDPWTSRGKVLQSMKNRKLDRILDRGDIRTTFRAIQGYDEKALEVRKAFSDFDYRVCGKFERVGTISGIDPWFVNNMEEPIEDVELRLVYKQYNNKKKKSKNNTKNKEPKKQEQPVKQTPAKKESVPHNTPSLSKWL